MADTLPTVLAARCPRCERLVQIDGALRGYVTGICRHTWRLTRDEERTPSGICRCTDCGDTDSAHFAPSHRRPGERCRACRAVVNRAYRQRHRSAALAAHERAS